jgi:DNA-nicking Smr family endonuclease
MSDKSKAKSLKDQLAPLREKMKVDELKANQARDEERRAEKQAQKQAKKGAGGAGVSGVRAPAAASAKAGVPQRGGAGSARAPEGEGHSGLGVDGTSDSEVVEFWRAAAGTVAINAKGREVQEPKRKAGTGVAGQAEEAPKATKQDQADFSAWLDGLSEEQAATIAYQKEGRTPPPGRAISKDRVLLEGLAPGAARERLQRFLKAAGTRGERSVSVSSGGDPVLRAQVRGWLETEREVAFIEESPEGGAWRVTLNRGDLAGKK